MATDRRPRRLDVELVHRGLARSRSQARALIADGQVRVGGAVTTKPSVSVAAAEAVDLLTAPDPWVGRGAYKLLKALDVFGPRGLTVAGRRCLDVGASTGGFTQVLLAAGAAHVTALDVGHGQLASTVADDPRVVERSGLNIRDVRPGDLGDDFDVVVADLSFISLTYAVGPVRAVLAEDGQAVLLVKPQFEVGRERLPHTGVVSSEVERRRAVDAVVAAASACGLHRRGLVPSPVPGANGNQEYLLWVSTHTDAEGAP